MSSPAPEDSLTTASEPAPPPTVLSPPAASGARTGTPASRLARPRSGTSNPALRTIASLAVIAALYLGRAVLVPVALAAFVAFLLSPIAAAIEKVRVPRAAAATVSVLALALGLVAVMWETGWQAVDLAQRLPEYRRRLDEKLSFVRSGSASSGILQASERLKELGGDPKPDPAANPAGTTGTESPGQPARVTPPVAVRVVPDAPTSMEVYGSLAGSVLGPLGDGAIVILLAIFLLTYRVDVRERLLALGSAHRIGVTSQAIEEAGKRVARYLLANLAVNALYGIAVGVAVYLVGLPNAAVWGLLCGLLRFVPYVGTWLGAALPLAVSIAVFDGWGRTGAVFACILGIDIVVGNVVEPLVYGRRAGLSPLAVVLATVFWTWVWGIPGLLLAIPMTLCLAVVGRYVPGFGVFHVLLGNEPILDPAERAYERLLAFDAAGASRVSAAVRARLGAAEADDAVLLMVLRHAERDRREGQLDEERYLAICDGVREALDELEPAEAVALTTGSVLCLPAFAESDRVACEMLARHLAAAGVRALIGPNATTLSDDVAGAVREGVTAVCVVALPPFAGLRVRYGIRRARSQAPDARYVGVVLDPDAEKTRVEAALRQAGAQQTAFSLADAVSTLVPRPVAAKEPSRLDGVDKKGPCPAVLLEAGERT